MAKTVIPIALRERVMQRASHCCEYCRTLDSYLPHDFTMDHLLPISMFGTNDFENLAYACFICNRLKSNKLKVFDSMLEIWVDLFNPRIHKWKEHFFWSEDATEIIGKTSIGSMTIATLKLNRYKLLQCRKNLIEIGKHPPIDL